ncbi:MAG: response regulator, partial [Melioribacteraceae bacterium]|nr:response regulator [Melioribacteraceae bacterium]
MKKILIVDDEQEMLNSLEKILSHETKYNLKLVQDPKQALEEVKKKEFDLIITDLKMGQVSGLDILKNTSEHFPNTPVIMISGYGTIEASVEAIQNGAFDFIEKPFTSKKLLDCIKKALHEKSVESDSSNNISEL